jgi:hypothetical protein
MSAEGRSPGRMLCTSSGAPQARCTVERLMGELGIAGTAARRKKPRTTVPAPTGQPRPSDLLERDFTAVAPAAGGSPVSRMWIRPAVLFIPRLSLICFPAGLPGGRSRIRCGLSLPSMRWRWRSGHLGIRSVISSFIILTEASSTRLSVTRSGWEISARSAPWEVRKIPMIMQRQKR